MFFKHGEKTAAHLRRDRPLVGGLGLSGNIQADGRTGKITHRYEGGGRNDLARPLLFFGEFLAGSVDQFDYMVDVTGRRDANCQACAAVAHRLVDDVLDAAVGEVMDVAVIISDDR